MLSSSGSTPTGRGPSVTVTRMPGPVTGTVPARMPSVLACFCAAGERGALRLPVSLLELASRVASSRVDLVLGALGGAGQAGEHVDQVPSR